MSPEVRFGMLEQNPYRVFQIEDLEDATDNFDRSNVLHESSKFEVNKNRSPRFSRISNHGDFIHFFYSFRCIKVGLKMVLR